MVQNVCIEAGLGNPTDPHYTNEVESKNDTLKQYVYYKASEQLTFVDNMKDLLQQQQRKLRELSLLKESTSCKMTTKKVWCAVNQKVYFDS